MFISPDYSPRVLEQMEKTDVLLLKLKDVLNNPLVAGGAPRDWFFNYTATDIDIFTDAQDINQLAEDIKSNLNINIIETVLSENLPEDYRSNYISGVISFRFEYINFQIIIKNTIENVLSFFPISLSLITYENYCIKPTNVFLKAIRSSSMLILRSCSQKYERKIIQKFPSYSIQYVTHISLDTRIERQTLVNLADTW